MEFNRSARVTIMVARPKCLQVKAFMATADTAVTHAVIWSRFPVRVDNGTRALRVLFVITPGLQMDTNT